MCRKKSAMTRVSKVAVVGAGVIGCSSALALLETDPSLVDVTIFYDRPFEQTTSYGPAGLLRLNDIENRKWFKETFERYECLYKTIGGACGIQMVSGSILTDNLELAKIQESGMMDIVYNFRWISGREMSQFVNPSKYGVFFTSYTSEGRTYVPWLMEELRNRGAKFVERKIDALRDLSSEFDFIVNCAGLEAGKLAGDDSIVPMRGILFEIDAPWAKHFIYRDVGTFLIPTTNSVFVGTVKQMGRSEMVVNEEDEKDIRSRFSHLMPTLKDVKFGPPWVGLRPSREHLRVEMQTEKSINGKQYHIIHNYGHGANGFVLSWGCAMDVTRFIRDKMRFSHL